MISPLAPLHLTLNDLERSKSRSPNFETLYLAILLTLIGNHIDSPMGLWNLTLSDLERSKSRHSNFEWYQICMVYIYLPVAYQHFNLDITKENLLAAGFSAVPAVFLVSFGISLHLPDTYNTGDPPSQTKRYLGVGWGGGGRGGGTQLLVIHGRPNTSVHSLRQNLQIHFTITCKV